MKFKFHICCTGMHPKRLMEFGFTIHGSVTMLQIYLAGTIYSLSILSFELEFILHQHAIDFVYALFVP